jgi:hypothetical protein
MLSWAALSIALIVGGSSSAREDGARTSYTQAHGVRRTAQVISEDVSSGRSPTSTLTVRLSEPVNGHDTTTVHIDGEHVYAPGTSVTVVVDPQEPGYAELPGDSYASSGYWVFVLGLGLAGLIVPLITAVFYLGRWRRRRRASRCLPR